VLSRAVQPHANRLARAVEKNGDVSRVQALSDEKEHLFLGRRKVIHRLGGFIDNRAEDGIDRPTYFGDTLPRVGFPRQSYAHGAALVAKRLKYPSERMRMIGVLDLQQPHPRCADRLLSGRGVS
jgi:hypothetical protein